MQQQVALLRGINLGTVRRVAMADLRALLESLGYEDVRILGQTGNAVFRASGGSEEVGREIERRLAADLGVETPVVTRTRDELAAVIAHDPLGGVATDPKRHQVTFLAAEPSPAVVAALEAADFGAERLAIAGREIHAWHPDGIGRSPLARRLTDQRLGVTATARNWAVLTKLLALADG